ncbi:MAG: PorT family protein [Chitinophagaceae bacterium]|nr:PorT family protein [Chitinophagaceae bacterium]
MHSFDNDNELDQITRLASEAYEAPGKANWDKMQRVLDKELPQQKKRRAIIWWFLPLGIAAAIGIFWLTNPSTNSNSKNTNPVITNPIKPAQNSIVKEKEIINPYNKLTEQTAKAELVNKNIQQNKNIKPNFVTPQNKQETKAAPLFQELTQPLQKEIATESKAIAKNDPPATTSIPVASESPTPTDNTTATETNSKETKSGKIKITDTHKGFFVGLTAGVDVSTVKYHYGSSAGYNIGGTIGYRFNKHWSLQSGAVYTKKNYKMNGADFHPPKGSWISYFKLETVDGFCKMWEVPIIGTYHFTGDGKTNAFISLGSSSYFMKRENYTYEYYVNSQTYKKTVDYSSTDQHLFALVHISAGIEKPISKKLTSIIEPYAKIPLGGVGLGNIQLSSYGVNFSVQYRQPKKQSSRFHQ